MASKIDVINMAFTRVGDDTITSINENTERAGLAKILWDMALANELRAHVWKFAIKRASLPALVSTPAYGFNYEYQLPADCLRILQIGEMYPNVSIGDYITSDDSLYHIEGKKILTNMVSPLSIRYVALMSNTEDWDASFPMVFAMRMAMLMCEKLSDSAPKLETIAKDYGSYLLNASKANALETAPVTLPSSSWITCRL